MSVGLMPAPNPPTFDPLECASRSHEVQRLAWRVQSCVDRVDAVLSSLRKAQVDDWLSPAGRAYRTTIAVHASALMRARESLEASVALVLRHSQNVSVSSERGP
ncbi:hypothetical protein [Paenarthrobacter aurescens]|uniref:Uncharacterized protein n=1 Tax=Paenarthrobacter aurescens TaxID=43663 RepID=A0A4Y3NCC8_PAEAU|nr:hypothetical protein [Paenarthrobacter aurescens]MDO6149173.1 hypothetical protein [Paenarthrobacter aurescens]MDO6160417.1 hypothetical protein [Paenarthrobacter aurescens]MDO6164276.1 hypothetical protein [Paenarthrobacter aurescens]GEB19604.1 hypothetical protein AAU01_23590 [Paenarthrobacter aurescens]